MDIFDLIEKTPESKENQSVASRFMEEVLDFRAKKDVGTKSAPTGNTLTESVDTALKIVTSLPSGKYETDGYLFKGAMRLAGDDVKDNANFFLKGVGSIDKNGSRIDMERKGEIKVDINQDVAGGLVSIKSLKLGSTGFDIAQSGDIVQLRNVKGVSIDMNVAGSDTTIDVKKLTLSKDADGNPVLTASLENPLPATTRFMLGLSDTINVPISLGADGKSPSMTTSQILNTVADLTPNLPFLPGFITPGSMVRAAAYVAESAEDHPQAAKVAKNVLLGPVGSAVLDFAVESPTVTSTAKSAAKLAFSTSPVGMAYNWIWGN